MILRRHWLLGAVGSAVASCAWAEASQQEDDGPKIVFPTEARERIAIASWPFRKLLHPKSGTMPLLDFPAMVVERFDVHGIELLDEHFPETGGGYIDRLRTAIGKAKMKAVNLAVGGAGGSIYDPALRRELIEKARDWVDIASTLGCPAVRVHIAGMSGPPDVATAAEVLKVIADYGQAKGVVVHLENDDPKSEEAFFLIDVIKAAGTPWLRALPDFCNSMLLERGAEYNEKAVAAMFEHAYAVCHVKDSEKGFHVDLAKMMGIAKAAGYRGYYSIEYDGDGDPFAGTKRLVEAALGALG